MRTLALTLLSLVLASCGGRLAMVGFDRTGISTQAFVQEKDYSNYMTQAIVQVEESVLPVLNQTPQRGDWKLLTAAVGFGANAQVGVGPFQVAFKPKFRLIFGSVENPPVP